MKLLASQAMLVSSTITIVYAQSFCGAGMYRDSRVASAKRAGTGQRA